MSIEVTIYIVLALFLMTLRRIISGMKNGCFYGKNANPLPEKLADYIKNIHFLESPAWYVQFGAVFLFILALFRTIHPEWDLRTLGLELLADYLLTMGSSAMASYHFQGYINHGSGLPWIDPNENPKSEFAIKIFGKKYSYWWNRPWKGKWKLYSIFFGAVEIIIGIIIFSMI